CQAGKAAGSPCSGSSECADGLECSANDVCVALHGPGDSCEDGVSCVDGYQCIDDVCQAEWDVQRAGLGESCDGYEVRCKEDAFCDEGVCAPVRKAGQECLSFD